MAKRVVDMSFWTDDKVVDLFSPEDKYFFLYLLTNPHSTQLGIYPLNKKVAAFELGYSVEAVAVLLDRFQNKYQIIRYSEETGEVAILHYLRHSIVKGGKPVEDLLLREINNVKNKDLLRYVSESISEDDNLNDTVRTVLSNLHIYNSLEDKKENVNGNDNVNAVSYHDSYHDSYHESSKVPKRFVPPTVEEVRVYCSEKNYTGVDPEYFVDYYQMRGWVLTNGKKMVDWKAAVRNWVRMDRDRKRKNAPPEKDDFGDFLHGGN